MFVLELHLFEIKPRISKKPDVFTVEDVNTKQYFNFLFFILTIFIQTQSKKPSNQNLSPVKQEFSEPKPTEYRKWSKLKDIRMFFFVTSSKNVLIFFILSIIYNTGRIIDKKDIIPAEHVAKSSLGKYKCQHCDQQWPTEWFLSRFDYDIFFF